jgi:hypothetical protein
MAFTLNQVPAAEQEQIRAALAARGNPSPSRQVILDMYNQQLVRDMQAEGQPEQQQEGPRQPLRTDFGPPSTTPTQFGTN